MLARGTVGLDRLHQVFGVLSGEGWCRRVGAYTMRAVTSSAYGGARFTFGGIAGWRCTALLRHLRREVQGRALDIQTVHPAQHRIHGRRFTLPCQIFVRGIDKIYRLLAR